MLEHETISGIPDFFSPKITASLTKLKCNRSKQEIGINIRTASTKWKMLIRENNVNQAKFKFISSVDSLDKLSYFKLN